MTNKEIFKQWCAEVRIDIKYAATKSQQDEYISYLNYLLYLGHEQEVYHIIVWRLEGVEFHSLPLQSIKFFLDEGSGVYPDLDKEGPSNLDHIDL